MGGGDTQGKNTKGSTFDTTFPPRLISTAKTFDIERHLATLVLQSSNPVVTLRRRPVDSVVVSVMMLRSMHN